MEVAILKESQANERRVALVPPHLKSLIDAGCGLRIESGAGTEAGFIDTDYQSAGASVIESRAELLEGSDVILQVRSFGANPEMAESELNSFSSGQVVIGMNEPLTEFETMKSVADKGLTLFALELLPRITRAQSMDVLSSMATIAGYKAVMLAANRLPKMFPMMMTAAGTIKAAKVFVVGAGVAGLQAIASARRLGAIVHAYDIRPAVKEQVESLGGKFVELEIDTGETESGGGYAKAMDEAFYERQRELMKSVIAESDVVITTAAVPGKRAPILVTEEMVKVMRPGTLIVDIAAERGGNCELTKPGEDVHINGVTIMGQLNLPSTIPYHASQMYSKNISTFLLNMIEDGALKLNLDDEIVRETVVASNGQVVNPSVRELLNLEPLALEHTTE